MRRIAADLLFQVINLRYEQGNMIEFPDKLIGPHGSLAGRRSLPLTRPASGGDSDSYGFKRFDLRESASMSQESIEQRLAAVETAVSEIQRRLERLSPSPNWLSQVIGSLKDEPAFEEVIAYGKAIREAESA